MAELQGQFGAVFRNMKLTNINRSDKKGVSGYVYTMWHILMLWLCKVTKVMQTLVLNSKS